MPVCLYTDLAQLTSELGIALDLYKFFSEHRSQFGLVHSFERPRRATVGVHALLGALNQFATSDCTRASEDMPYVQLDEYNVFYEQQGQGDKVLVLLPGSLGLPPLPIVGPQQFSYL